MQKWSRRKFMKNSALAVAGAMSGIGIPAAASETGKRGRLPNIMLITVDSLRADHCSCYGYNRRTTPFLDSLAKDGVRFSRHLSSSSWTTPSIMSMFTGLSPIHHGVVNTGRVLPAEIDTLAGRLRKRGYHTIGVLCNPCAAGRMGFSRGFDVYDDFTMLLDIEINIFDVGKTSPGSIHRVCTSGMTSTLALEYLRRAPKGKPIFMFVLFFDPHGDYVPAGKYATMFDRDYTGSATGRVYGLPRGYRYRHARDLAHVIALYDGEIRQTDDGISRLVRTMKNEGYCTDDDLLIYTADHGEEFLEHGGLRHGRTLYREVVNIPCVIRWPGRLPRGRVVETLTHHQDLMPTLLAAAGDHQAAAGCNLTALARNEQGLRRRELGLHLGLEGGMTGMSSTDWSVLRATGSGRTEAFNLVDDPDQQHPLSPEANPVTREMLRRLCRWVRAEASMAARYAKADARTGVRLTRQQIRALKAMGYIH